MEIRQQAYHPQFTSKIVTSKATKEVDEYAKTLGIENFTKSINEKIKYNQKLSLNIKHIYSKIARATKTEINYEKNGFKYKELLLSDCKTPAEFTMQVLSDIGDGVGKTFKNIFG